MIPDGTHGVEQPRLWTETRPVTGGTVVTLRGALDMGTVKVLAGELGPVHRDLRGSKVIFDLSGLEFCDSSGMGSLVSVWKRVRESGGDVAFAGVHGMCARIMQTTGLHRVFTLYETLDEAQDAFDFSAG